MNETFFSTQTGRMFAGILAFFAATAGVVTLSGDTLVTHTVVLPALLLVAIAATIIAVGLTANEHGGAALIMVLSLPPLGGVYYGVSAGLLVHAGAGVAAVCFALSLVPIYVALRPARTRTSSSSSRSSTRAAA